MNFKKGCFSMFDQNRYDYQPGFQEQDPNNNGYSGENSYVNIYSDPASQQPAPKKSHGKTALKVIAALAACAVVSVSSVELYKHLGGGMIGEQEKNTGGRPALSVNNVEETAADTTETENDTTETKGTTSSGTLPTWVSQAAPEDALTIPQIVEKALPSVVGISSVFEAESGSSGYSYWGFNFYGNDDGQKRQFTGTGTGIIMSEDGYVITNAHCIYDNESEYDAGEAVSVSVVIGDENETEYDAQIVGYDIQTDLAVLKIDATGLTPAEFGDSDKLAVGELVVAIGNPLGFELFGTTTCGIVSALNREVTIDDREMTLIQTDAAINSGNSGGPLLNGYGQVIGINSAKMSSSYGSASVEGLGFAIPISSARDIIDSLIKNGYVTGRPQIGITGQNVTESDSERFGIPQGVYVYAVEKESAADEAGIRQGDIITSIDGTDISTWDELNEIKNKHNAGDTVKLKLYRSGETLSVDLKLQEAQQTTD